MSARRPHDSHLTPLAETSIHELLHALPGAPCEFARLLLVLSEAERRWREEELRPYLNEQRLLAHLRGEDTSAGITIDPSVPINPWWEIERMRAPVVAQLRHCLAALEGKPSEAGEL